MSEKKLGPGDPDFVFPKEVHNLLVAANATNITLSGMADTKASILMGASFVVFSMSISDIADGKASLPLLVLTLFSFVATVFGRADRPAQPDAGQQDADPARQDQHPVFRQLHQRPPRGLCRRDDRGAVVGRGDLPADDRRTSTTMASCCATTSSAGSTGASPCSSSAWSRPPIAVVYPAVLARASLPPGTSGRLRRGPRRYRSIGRHSASGAPRDGSTIQSGWQK